MGETEKREGEDAVSKGFQYKQGLSLAVCVRECDCALCVCVCVYVGEGGMQLQAFKCYKPSPVRSRMGNTLLLLLD